MQRGKEVSSDETEPGTPLDLRGTDAVHGARVPDAEDASRAGHGVYLLSVGC